MHGLAEEVARALRNTVDGERPLLPQIHLVQVHLQNLGLREAAFEHQRQDGLVDFRAQRPAAPSEDLLHDLLCDRAAAFDDATLAHVAHERPADATAVQARMTEEAPVFRRQNGQHQPRRHVGVGDGRAPLAQRLPKRRDVLGRQHGALPRVAVDIDVLDDRTVQDQRDQWRTRVDFGCRRVTELDRTTVDAELAGIGDALDASQAGTPESRRNTRGARIGADAHLDRRADDVRVAVCGECFELVQNA